MSYTFHQLKIFQIICETGSITKAAGKLKLTQPAVSIQLKNLQEQFEIPLTEVIGRKIYITDFGKKVAEAADRILNEAESIDHLTLAHKGFLTGKLSIINASTAKYVMPFFMAEFINQHAGLELNIKVSNKSDVIKALEANQVDFAMVSMLPKDLSIERTPLLPSRLYLVGAPHLIRNKGRLNHHDLEELPLIFREEDSASRITLNKFLKENQLNIKNRLVLSSNEAVKQALIAGLGHSLLSLNGIKNELLNKELEIIPMNNLPIILEWNLIWLKEKKFSPAALAYLDFLRANKERLIKQHFEWSKKFNV